MEKLKRGYRLSNGKTIEPNKGFFGLTEEDDVFEICEGYDSEYMTKQNTYDDDDIDLTNEEIKEIAVYMSNLWIKYANSLN